MIWSQARIAAAYYKETITLTTPDTTPPTIQVQQSGTLLFYGHAPVPADHPVDNWRWHLSTKPDCSTRYYGNAVSVKSGTGFTYSRPDRSYGLNGKYICFWADDAAGNSGYGSMQLPDIDSIVQPPPPITNDAPVISLAQSYTLLGIYAPPEGDISIDASVTNTNQNIVTWNLYLLRENPTNDDCRDNQSGFKGIRTNSRLASTRTTSATALFPQSVARNGYPWLCVEAVNDAGIKGTESIKLVAQRASRLVLSQLWDRDQGKVKVYALSPTAVIDIGAGGKWRYGITHSATNCNFNHIYTLRMEALLIDYGAGGLDFRLHSKQAQKHIDPSPDAPGAYNYMCVRSYSHLNVPVEQGYIKVMRAPSAPSPCGQTLNCPPPAPIRQKLHIEAEGCSIQARWLMRTATNILNGAGEYERPAQRSIHLVASGGTLSVSVDGVNYSVGGRLNKTNALDLSEAVELVDLHTSTLSDFNSAVATIRGWRNFQVSQYYSGGNLKSFQDLANAIGTLVNAPATAVTQVDMSRLSSAAECVDEAEKPCPDPAVTPDTYTFSGGPHSAGNGSRNISYTTSDWFEVPDPDPNAPPGATIWEEQLTPGRGTFKYYYPSYAMVQADIEAMLDKIAVNGHIRDTSTSLTIDSTHPALLEPIYYYQDLSTSSTPASTFEEAISSSGPPVEYYSSPHYHTYYDDQNYELRLTVQRVRRLDQNGNPISPNLSTSPSSTTLTSGNSRLLTASDNSSYGQTVVQGYQWVIGWRLDIKQSVTFMHADADEDMYGVYTDWGSLSSNVLNITLPTRSFSGNWTTHTCSLMVEPPSCQISFSPFLDFNAAYPDEIRTETFDPNTQYGSSRTPQSPIFPVGREMSRTRIRATNNNPFPIVTASSHHPTFSVTAIAPYHSGYNAAGSSADNIYQYIAANGGNGYYDEPLNAINYPGKYRTAWTVDWQTQVGFWPTSERWRGIEHDDNRCMPSSQLSLETYAYADPPTCSISGFAYEVTDTPYASVTITNRNYEPMWVGRANWNVERGGNSYGSGNAAANQRVPPVDENNGELTISIALPPITHTGQFEISWSLMTRMGTEAWTSNDNDTGQRSWFLSRDDERIEPDGDPGNECRATGKVFRKPFIKVFFGSLLGGGQFGSATKYDACNDFTEVVGNPGDAAQAFVAGWSEGTSISNARGSSVEYALLANHEINGFYSASQRSSDPQPLKGLTLSNNNGTDPYGSSFGKKTCLANYWREAEQLDTEPPLPLDQLDLADLRANDRKLYNPTSGLLEISSDGNPLNLKATVYVNGDVHITSDIINNQGAVWRDPSEIGYLTIIAHGNIYIDKGVGRIDALLVAYPKGSGSPVGGIVMTCYYDDIAVLAATSNSHFHECGKQLVVNGAIVAEKILFGRTYGSVKLETGYPASPDSLDPDYTKAAEVINLLPEYLIGIPELPLFPDQIYRTDSLSTKPVNF